MTFLSLALSQHYVSRYGIFEGRYVTIVEKEWERPMTRDPAMALSVPQIRNMSIEGLIKRWDTEGRIPIGALSHKSSATGSNREDCVSRRRRQPGQRSDQPAGEAWNENMKLRREGQLKPGSRSAPGAAGPGGGDAKSQKGRLVGREVRVGEGVSRPT